MTTKARRAALRDLLAGGQASTQAELCTLLAERGFTATQSTVSRDLKRLGAERALGADGIPVYRLGRPPSRKGPSARTVTTIEHNECLVVLRTRPGMAQAVGIELDELGHEDIIGTLAGDDTVLVVPRSIARIETLVRDLAARVGIGLESPPRPR
ncbi:arginine repressor [Paraliomyxa miuraensis]|uniref:arginine repressor n=1 Tax=Paraliomyxa miuraensis TaxID=376150 RepID=UPI0022586350|nr:arginine repressor [Paraliomyxa miuraensis]MCX4239877.1 arginine repressor [Paraliomyxa miuraensis]